MHRLANELHRGDTVFVTRPEVREHDLKLRFFTPTREVPFIGHCTIAAHYALGCDGAERPRHVRQETGAGVIDVEVRGQGEDRTIAMTLSPPTLGRLLDERERSQVLDALGLSTGELDGACPMRIAFKGGSRLLIGLKSVRRLDVLKPDLAMLKRLSMHLGADGFFVFAREGATEGCLTESRMFCPAIGIDEDPVSGNAHGMLAVYFQVHGLLSVAGGRASFQGLQGRALGRLGRVDIEIKIVDANVASVTVAGQAVLVYRTTVSL
jgi:PhzF family phenazine biosynthesis protein